MPCPLFEPRQRISQSPETMIRLPLIFEFEGVCHAGDHAPTPEHRLRYCNPAEHRLRYCNQGYAKGHCASFPDAGPISAVRFDVKSRTPSLLTVLVLEEENYWPRAWSTVEFLIQDRTLRPEIEDTCRRAQILQFCQAYLSFGLQTNVAGS